MNTTVNTVTGPIDINELGFISPHEHVLYAARDNCEEAVLEELRTACPGTHEGEPKDGEIVIEFCDRVRRIPIRVTDPKDIIKL